MPKRSKEDTEITIHKIMDAVVDQLLRLGYDKMSYTTLSQQTGVSRTGISHHFPKKTDFTAALDGRIFKMFVEHVDFDNGLEAFSTSWVNALENEEFRAILRLLFHHLVTSQKTHEFATNGIDRLYKMTKAQFGPDSAKELEWLIGKSLVSMA
ncbi:TetR/AcrR family transcriptional regulator [Vibrio nereis]|uniref:Transcriptional regulator n=1 Tax=Vibrio nereis TaxID=693 RepID=A0A0M0HLX5_VIBNE|nr:TetR/AcrR family transcriptional regulator [Vibrio nereis]KOO03026.1 transcriptional regulator [Vibrio nereis]